jgi:hypothetical protein
MAAASVEIYRNGGVGRVEVEVAVAVAVAVRARARGPAQMARRTIMVALSVGAVSAAVHGGWGRVEAAVASVVGRVVVRLQNV